MNLLSYVYKYVAALLSVVLCLFTSVPFIIKQSADEKEKNITEQIERMEQLEEDYASGNYVKIDENSFADFDLQKYGDKVKINEISCLGTHNSYQLASVPAYQKLMDNLSTVTFGLVSSVKPKFSSETLTEQFNVGVRSIELDIETVVSDGEISFVCNHSPVFDMTTTCYNFELALKEIAMWSDANPNHVPITIIIEPKTAFLPDGSEMKYMNIEYANALDELLREVLGDRLLTPADAMGDYSSLKEMREADAWPTLNEASGKVLVLLHDTTVTDKYIGQDKSIKTQAMFPMLRYDDIDKSYASFIIMNDADDAYEHRAEVIGEKKLMVRTRADTFSDVDEENIAYAKASGAQIVSTDHPPKTDMTGIDTVTSFDGYTIRLNRSEI